MKALFAGVASLFAVALPSSSAAERPLDGVYVYLQKTTSVTKMPVISDVVATTRAVSIQRLSFDGKWLRGTGTLCDVQITSNSKLVRTILPPAFRKALPPVSTNARITEEGGTLRFEQPAQTLVIGADLAQKESDPLPTSSQDARVRDHDRDGHPGVTVKIDGIVSGDIYLVQRSTSRLSGHSTPSGFHGRIDFTNDQEILGATKGVLERNPRATPDPARSEFVLHKVDAQITCAEARRMAVGF